MQPLFDLTPYTQDTPTKDTQGLALFEWASVQETKQAQPAQVEIPLPDSKLFDHYRRVLYVAVKGEKQAICAHCLREITKTRMPKPSIWRPIPHGWGKCETCDWKNTHRDVDAKTVQYHAWVKGYQAEFALTFPAWYEKLNSEVVEESDHPAISWTTWDKLHRAWLSGKAPSDTADDLLYTSGFRHNWDDDETESDEDTVLGA